MDFEEIVRRVFREEIEKTGQEHRLGKLLTQEEVANALQIKPQTLAVWRSRGGRGPAWQKVAGAIRYRVEEVQKWLDQQTVQAR